MKERLTAAKAAEIADRNNPDKAVDEILEEVQKQAEKGLRVLRVKKHGFGTDCYVSRKEWPELCRRIQDELRALGYKADFRSEERQFVDMWLEVSW